MSWRRAVICAGMFASINLGCAAIQRGDETHGSPPARTERLLPASALEGDWILQQRVTIRWQDREEGFDAVLQKRGDELLLLGLGPMNSVGFTLTLDGQDVRFENRSGRDMPFEPERILADVQRVFYPWITPVQSCTNCQRHVVRADLDVSESIGVEWLEERRFEDTSGRDRGTIVVRFENWVEGGAIPGRAVLDNAWYGYELIVETMHVERLE